MKTSPYRQSGQIEELAVSSGEHLFYRAWVSPVAKASVIYIAGIESHGGWYEGSASYLFSRGLNVFVLDRRGTGLNPQNRGDLQSFHILLDDLNAMFERVQTVAPEKPIHLIALSWGAKWAVSWALRQPQNKVSSLSLITPGLFRKVDLPLWTKTKAAWAIFTQPQKHFLIPIRKEQYTSQNAWLTFIAQDPLRLKSLTAQFLKEDLKITLDFKNLKGEFPSRVKLFLAEKDTIVNNQKAFLFCQKRAKRCEQVVYPNTVHTLEFETCRDQYFKDLGDWILDEQG